MNKRSIMKKIDEWLKRYEFPAMNLICQMKGTKNDSM